MMTDGLWGIQKYVMDLFGGVEAGGTTFVCGVGAGRGHLHHREEFATGAAKDTLDRVLSFFQPFRSELRAIGIASFGPIALNGPHRGYITATPKKGWAYTNFVGPVEDEFRVPVGFDTDVNGAAVAEGRWGAAKDMDTFVYVTAGTGVGGGGMFAGHAIHGLLPSEMGHMRIPRHASDPLRKGTCRFHDDCWEGWASKLAIERRWGKGRLATSLMRSERQLLTHYLALGVANVVCTLSPQRIILGGGIILGGDNSSAHRDRMFRLIRQRTVRLLNDFIQVKEITEDIDKYIVPPALGKNAGVLGAIALGQDALLRGTSDISL